MGRVPVFCVLASAAVLAVVSVSMYLRRTRVPSPDDTSRKDEPIELNPQAVKTPTCTAGCGPDDACPNAVQGTSGVPLYVSTRVPASEIGRDPVETDSSSSLNK